MIPKELEQAIRRENRFIFAKAAWLPKPRNHILLWPLKELLSRRDEGETLAGLCIDVQTQAQLDEVTGRVLELKEPKPKLFTLVPKKIPIANIVPGPILHQSLPSELEERIRKLEPVLAEVYPISHQEWLEGFQRDLNPEAEVSIFEAIAAAYQGFLAKHALVLPAKKEAYAMLVTSGGTVEETLARAKLRNLSRKEAEKLLLLYAAALAKNQKPFSPN